MASGDTRRLTLRYGEGVLEAALPAQWNIDMLGVAPPTVERTEHDCIVTALSAPIATSPLRETLRHDMNVVVIVPDKTRLCRSELYLPYILEEIHAAAIPREQVRIIFATGTHAPQEREEYVRLLGPDILARYSVLEHDSRDAASCVHLGRTRFGTDVSLNRIVAEADFVIATGSIVHHYFAGFGGGAKMFLPGVASYETAVQNHRRTISADGTFHPGCVEGEMQGNPVMEDIRDAIRFFPPNSYFGVIVNDDGRIVDAVYGDIEAAHTAGCGIVHARNAVTLAHTYDICIASAGGFPRDINFIQSHKAMHHACYAVRDGGVLICVAQCQEGIGNSEFLEYFRCTSAEEFRRHILEQYSMNAHTALAVREKAARYKLILISDLDSADVRLMGLEAACSLRDAIEIAAATISDDASVGILENASRSLPVPPRF